MSARKVIADFLKVRDENVPPDECSDDERTESATAIIEDLTAAGYTIIRDDENHKATVERCIAECDRIDNECGMEAGLAAACSDALRSLIKEDGE